MIKQHFLNCWYCKKRCFLFKCLLWPFSKLYQLIITIRRYWLQRHAYQSHKPVIMIGNITVGGTGKTPVVIAIARWLSKQHYQIAIISRGYQASATTFPMQVTADIDCQQCGDEPYMMHQSLPDVPVIIDPKRARAVAWIEHHYPKTDIILSDDGLQHYALARAYEIVVIDGARGQGNGLLLPAGPLREPLSRLNTVDQIVINQGQPITMSHHVPSQSMQIIPTAFVHIKTGKRVSIKDWVDQQVVAIAGIGNPERFEKTLEQCQIKIIQSHWFSDHYHYAPSDFDHLSNDVLVTMTQKDAVKCQSFAKDHWWYLEIGTNLPDTFFQAIVQQLQLSNNKTRGIEL